MIFLSSSGTQTSVFPCAGWAFLAMGTADTAMGTTDTAMRTADMGKSRTTF